MRLLLDTNVLIAALVARGTCSDLLEHCVRQHTIVSSQQLLDELRDVLSRKFRQLCSAIIVAGLEPRHAATRSRRYS